MFTLFTNFMYQYYIHKPVGWYISFEIKLSYNKALYVFDKRRVFEIGLVARIEYIDSKRM